MRWRSTTCEETVRPAGPGERLRGGASQPIRLIRTCDRRDRVLGAPALCLASAQHEYAAPPKVQRMSSRPGCSGHTPRERGGHGVVPDQTDGNPCQCRDPPCVMLLKYGVGYANVGDRADPANDKE